MHMENNMTLNQLSAVVVGGIGTDIAGLRLNRLVGPGELELGGELRVGAGGKSRNIAQMMATLLGPDRVAMVGKTSRDPFQLWKVPVDALHNAGVNVGFIKILDFETSGKYPQVALIAVDKQGNNQIYVLPGINEDFSPYDVEESQPAFAEVKKNNGIVALSLELPLETAAATIKLANKMGLRVLLDPGGIRPEQDHDALFDQPIFLIKPNEHETYILTGIEVTNEDEAHKAARVFLERGVSNVMITRGKHGAVLCSNDLVRHFPIPSLSGKNTHDATGCGDQTMATLCARLLMGDDIASAAERSVLAGTLQFHKLGIVPITAIELEQFASQT